jgi:SAM-dependent methyltransferase
MRQNRLFNKFHRTRIRHIASFLKAQLTVGKVLKTIDFTQFKSYQERFRDADPHPGYSKYLDIRFWMADKLMYFYILNLHKSKPLRILDIGTGTGYFPYISLLYGHHVVALDLGDVPMYNELCKFFRIDHRIWRIEKFQKLPDLGDKFDLITGFMIKFNQHNMPDEWGVGEWQFMLEDLKINQLIENGRIFLNFNGSPDGSYLDISLLHYFRSIGARVYRDQVVIGGPKQNIMSYYLDRFLS